MEESEILAVIEAAVGSSMPRRPAAVELQRRLQEAITHLENSMVERATGRQYGIFQPEVHQSLVRVRETFKVVTPVVFGIRDSQASNLLSDVIRFTTTLQETIASPNDPSKMQGLRSVADETDLHFTDIAALAAMVRLAYEASRGAAQVVVQEQETTADQLRREVANVRAALKSYSDELVAEISIRGSETVARAKKAVRDVLLINAKHEFDRSRRWLWAQVAAWLIGAAGSIAAFFAYAFHVVAQQHLPDTWSWQIAYYTGIRFVIIGGIGAVASFCLRMLKAHINLVHMSSHRSRVVNSIADFVEAAPREQQFEIFRVLIDTVVSPIGVGISDSNPEIVSGSTKFIEQLATHRGTKE